MILCVPKHLIIFSKIRTECVLNPHSWVYNWVLGRYREIVMEMLKKKTGNFEKILKILLT